ncbi:LAGLIDADG family homing endonuclease [Candidatus Peribacteria bacterium]|nr:LAGLIDADG family homing endonuclease [Candidatus Peribacteria bacterium]
MSDNPISADNQQERLLDAYLTGFADGKGSFNVSFRKRKDYKLPWKVSACFNISQKEKRILEIFQKHLQCGTLRSRPDGVWYYEVNSLIDLQKYIIPFFQRNPFLSEKKQRDFFLFQRIALLLSSNQHLQQSGIQNILTLRRNMNGGGKRKYSEVEILSAFSKESSETICQTH